MIARRIRVADVHVGLDPVPNGVELGLLVQLHRDHHAVRHSLGAHVVIVPIGEIGKRAVGIFTHGKDNGLLLGVAVEQLLESSVDFCRNFGLRVAGFREQVAILPSRIRAVSGLRLFVCQSNRRVDAEQQSGA